MSYREFFKGVTGFYPYPYQDLVEERLRAGDSIILRVPTGAGKTWAAVAPFVYALTTNRPMADRLLYALPLRSLASSLHDTVYGGMAKVFGRLSKVGNDREYGTETRHCSLQIGGQKDDAFFESDLVFTTIDQLLSGYVLLPVSLPDRVGNINAGALIGSLVVLDEIHLLDSAAAFGTVIEMVDRLRGVCQFVLMTATTSDKAISWLGRRLGIVPIEVPDSEIRDLPSQRTKQRTWRWSGKPLDAAAIADQHNGGRTIVLLNSVGRAQDLFLDLEHHYSKCSNAPRLLLLHARFYPEDRKAVEDELPGYFGPKARETNVILVTTQVIEAGMDLSADRLLCELAPMNSLVQRAGRTARFKDRPIGCIIVYEVLNLGPYRADKPLVDATRGALQVLPLEGRLVDFAEERSWVETVHAVAEETELKQYDNLRTRRDEVHKAMDQGERGRLSKLVRDIDSVGVVIAQHPESLFEGRAWPRLLSLSGYSLMSLTPHFQNLEAARWAAKGAAERENDERPGSILEWRTLSARELRAQWLVAIHPDFAFYHPRLGLRLGEAGPPPPVVFNEAPPAQHYDYQFEPWTKHRERIVARAHSMRHSYKRSAESLAAKYGVTANEIESLVEISCALHDVGKLAIDWQQVAWRWQDDKDARARAGGLPVPTRPRVPLAHTWFQSGVDRPLARKVEYRFPPHAAQGAFAVCNALAAHLIDMGGEEWGQMAARSAITAITRHHGARTRQCTLFRLPPRSEGIVAEGVPVRRLELQQCEDPLDRDQFPEVLLTFCAERDEHAWPLYAFLVRRLRLADQAATAWPTNQVQQASPSQIGGPPEHLSLAHV